MSTTKKKPSKPIFGRKAYSDFDDAIIRVIPSNLIAGVLLKRTPGAISVRRSHIDGAIKATGKRYTTKNLKPFLPIIEELCIKYKATVNHSKFNTLEKVLGTKQPAKETKLHKASKSTVVDFKSYEKSVSVTINGKVVSIQEGDALTIKEGRIAILTERKY